MKYSSPLIPGTLTRRYRRSLVDVLLEDGTTVTAHNPTFGKMTGCSEIGRPVLLADSENPLRRHRHTWEMIDMDGTLIGVNPGTAHKAVIEALERGRIPTLSADDIQHNAKFGHNRKVDIIMQGMEQNCFINIHNVTWVENGVALFPDSPSAPACRSMQELGDIARQGHRAIALFVVQRNDCERFKPAEEVDRDFLKATLAAHSAGTELLVYRASVNPTAVALDAQIPYSLE